MSAARVLLAEDHKETRLLLRRLLEQEFDVVEGVENGNVLVSAAERLSPDVIVTDISMPGLDGIAAASRILRRDPTAIVVFVTSHSDPYLRERALAAGGAAYVLKHTAGDELVPAVRAALLERPVGRH